MKVKSSRRNKDHFVRCATCGTRIRRHAHEESSAACLKCFYKFLNDTLTAQKGLLREGFASDR